ncbi:MAG: sorbosone dehydrogenase family protein [Sphingomicrobium sp.]
MKKLTLLAATAALAACRQEQAIPDGSQFGANPNLPNPVMNLMPDVHIPTVVGWKPGETPTVPSGFTIAPVASDLANPRRILPLPNGDILVVDSKKTAPEPVTRPKDVIMGFLFSQAHGSGGPKRDSNQVILLRDSNGDGKADVERVLIDKLDAPFGIGYSNGQLYIAETGALLAYPFTPGQTAIAGPPRKIVDLPEGPINHHWTKDLAISPDGTKILVGVGSNSNIVERGIEAETNRAAIWEVDAKTGAWRMFASGLRNPNGLTFYPGSNRLYAVINERDELGPDLVPDYLTSVKDGGFYGWPYSYYGKHLDPRVMPQRPDLVARAIPPDYALSSHVAPLGLTFYTGASFPAAFRGAALVGEHGSWDRNGLHGYQIAVVRFEGGKPVGNPRTFVAGFVKDGKARGRPVGVAVDRTGALLIADDVGNTVWRVSYASKPKPAKL